MRDQFWCVCVLCMRDSSLGAGVSSQNLFWLLSLSSNVSLYYYYSPKVVLSMYFGMGKGQIKKG